MKKLLIILILLFGSLVLIGVIGANFFLDLFCRQALVLIPKYSAEFGMQMIEPKYDQVRFASPRKVSWYNAKVMLRPSFQGEFTARKFFDFRAGEISLETADFSFERFRVVGRNADIRYTRAATAAFLDEKSALGENWDVGKLQGESFAIDINFNFRKPFAGIREMIGQVKELLSAGRVEAGISWKGRYTLVVGPNTEHWVGVQIEQIGNESVINLNQNDLRALSQYFDRLTDAQIEIVRHHPHQASALVKIQFDAEKT
ncbi:MAG TPA: hypothetical protein PLP17_02940, partial [Oligoflexia bacterium]|nr:hypothetical protein [Oligoflexia bacterium]